MFLPVCFCFFRLSFFLAWCTRPKPCAVLCLIGSFSCVSVLFCSLYCFVCLVFLLLTNRWLSPRCCFLFLSLFLVLAHRPQPVDIDWSQVLIEEDDTTNATQQSEKDTLLSSEPEEADYSHMTLAHLKRYGIET